MNQLAWTWVSLLVGAAIAGAAVVGVLVVRREMELVTAALGLAGFVIAAFAFAEVFRAYDRPDAALWALAFTVAAAGGGYALASTLLYRYGIRSRSPEVRDVVPADPGTHAVVLVASVESKSYDPRDTARMLQALADEGLLDASIGVLPFLFFAQKARYRVVADYSPSTSELASVADRLSEAVLEPGATVSRVSDADVDGVVDAVVSAVNLGHRRIVVAQLFVAEPPQMEVVRAQVAALRLGAHGVDVRFARPLSDSDGIIAMLAERVMHAAKESTGVVLVGHGQPEERARAHPAFDEQETAFLTRLRMQLVESGVPEDRVRIAWAEWGTPDVTTTVRHLAALECDRILVVPAAFPLDTVTTRLDLEISVRQARVPEDTVATTLPTWRDDPAVIEALRTHIAAALAE